MTQEDKLLLIKDLSARLPYAVTVEHTSGLRSTLHDLTTLHLYNGDDIEDIDCGIHFFGDDDWFNVEYFKPYLFPLSSMTEEQEKEISKRYNYYHYYGTSVEITNHREGFWDNDNSCLLEDYLWLEDWYNKNHIDYRGLIPMGLAENASGKNIY